MRRVVNRETQEGRFNLNWLAVTMLTLIFVVPAGSEEIAQEPQQADPNAPQKKIRGWKVDNLDLGWPYSQNQPDSCSQGP